MLIYHSFFLFTSFFMPTKAMVLTSCKNFMYFSQQKKTQKQQEILCLDQKTQHLKVKLSFDLKFRRSM